MTVNIISSLISAICVSDTGRRRMLDNTERF